MKEELASRNYNFRLTESEKNALSDLAKISGNSESNAIREGLRLLAIAYSIDLGGVFRNRQAGNWTAGPNRSGSKNKTKKENI